MIPPAQNSTSPSSRVRSTDSREFVTALARAYTLSEIFPLHHPTVQDAVRDVADWLGQIEFTVVQVEPIGLIIDQDVAPDDHGHVREFARDLSLAGVTEIAFGTSLDPDHVERLLTALRVVSEEPDVALDDFLCRDGACDVELAFHGGPRSPVSADPSVEPEVAVIAEAPPEPEIDPVPPAGISPSSSESAETLPRLGAVKPEGPAALQPHTAPKLLAAPVEYVESEPAATPELSIVPSHFAVDGVDAEAQSGFEGLSAGEALEFEQQHATERSGADEDPVAADPEFETAPVEPLELEVDEPLREFTVEEEIDEELIIEPLGAFLVDSTTERDAQERPAEPAEPPAESAGSDWRAEVRSRLMSASDVSVAKSDEANEADPSDAAAPETAVNEVAAPEGVAPQASDDVHEEGPGDATLEVEEERFDDVDLMLPGVVHEWDRMSYAAEWGAELDGELEEEDEYPSYSEWIAEEGTEDSEAVEIEAATEQAVPVEEDADLLAKDFVPPVDADDAADEAHQPVAPVLDEIEQDLVDTAGDPSEAAEPLVGVDVGGDASTEVTPAPAWPSQAYVSAFQAALSENGNSASAVPEHEADREVAHTVLAAPEPVPGVEEALISAFWVEDTAAVARSVDGSGLEVTPEALAEYEDEGPAFPDVDSLAPDGPALLRMDSSAADAMTPADPEVELLENELAAEADTHSVATATEPLPGEIWSPARESYEGGAVASMVEAPSVAPLVAFAKQFIEAQEPAKGALGETMRVEAAHLLEQDRVEDIAASIDVLVREAVPGDHAATDLARELATPRAVDELCARLSDVRDADRRDELIYVFGQLSAITAPALSDLLSEVPPRTARRNFMDALFRMKAEAIAVAVPMLEDSRWFIVRNGVDVLGEAGDESCVAKLAPSLAHPDQRVRRATVMALAKLGGERAGGELLPVLEDPNAEVREAAAMALGHLRIQKALRPMLALLDRDKNDEAQMVILRSLGQIGDPGAVPSIEKRAVGFFFIKPSKPVRIAAYRALAAIGTPHARQLVLDAVKDRDAEVAATAHTLAAQL